MDLDQFLKVDYSRHYIAEMRPVVNRKAMFSDTTEDYLSPCEPNPYSKIIIWLVFCFNRMYIICRFTYFYRHILLISHVTFSSFLCIFY